jgi:hypothetical protein
VKKEMCRCGWEKRKNARRIQGSPNKKAGNDFVPENVSRGIKCKEQMVVLGIHEPQPGP